MRGSIFRCRQSSIDRPCRVLKIKTLETTKPSYFYEGFVLYGAAPGVEPRSDLLIYRGFFLSLWGSISWSTLSVVWDLHILVSRLSFFGADIEISTWPAPVLVWY